MYDIRLPLKVGSSAPGNQARRYKGSGASKRAARSSAGTPRGARGYAAQCSSLLVNRRRSALTDRASVTEDNRPCNLLG